MFNHNPGKRLISFATNKNKAWLWKGTDLDDYPQVENNKNVRNSGSVYWYNRKFLYEYIGGQNHEKWNKKSLRVQK